MVSASRPTVIVQARIGSTRFPGKVLAPFGVGSLLGHLIARLAGTVELDDIWVATTEVAADDAVEAAAGRAGARVFRGPTDDVLGRFVGCIHAMPHVPEHVIRICADRPLLCGELVRELVEAYGDTDGPDYFANTYPQKSYPDGLDLELVRTSALLEAAEEAVDPYEREHVTPFIYRRPERYSLAGLACPFGNFSDVRATVDTPEDYAALYALDRSLGDDYDYRDVLNFAAVQPELFP